jgi:hypothetical protein
MVKVRIRYWDGVIKEYTFSSDEELYEFIRSSGDAVSEVTIIYH